MIVSQQSHNLWGKLSLIAVLRKCSSSYQWLSSCDTSSLGFNLLPLFFNMRNVLYQHIHEAEAGNKIVKHKAKKKKFLTTGWHVLRKLK